MAINNIFSSIIYNHCIIQLKIFGFIIYLVEIILKNNFVHDDTIKISKNEILRYNMLFMLVYYILLVPILC